MLFDDPASLEPGDVLDWFDLCSAGLAREEEEAYRLLGAEIEPRQPSFLPDVLGVGASREDIGKYFMACRRELEQHSLELEAEFLQYLHGSVIFGRRKGDDAVESERLGTELHYRCRRFEGVAFPAECRQVREADFDIGVRVPAQQAADPDRDREGLQLHQE
jgi:hypothetical protein